MEIFEDNAVFRFVFLVYVSQRREFVFGQEIPGVSSILEPVQSSLRSERYVCRSILKDAKPSPRPPSRQAARLEPPLNLCNSLPMMERLVIHATNLEAQLDLEVRVMTNNLAR